MPLYKDEDLEEREDGDDADVLELDKVKVLLKNPKVVEIVELHETYIDKIIENRLVANAVAKRIMRRK